MIAPLFDLKIPPQAFARTLATRVLGKTIVFLSRTQSTNTLAVEAARAGGAHGTVFITDAQDAGRGRRGRSWDCAPESGLLFSVLLRPMGIPADCIGWIPLIAGLSCVEGLVSLSPELNAVTVKWPNDIVFPSADFPGWEKLGGILCESALPALSNSPLPTAELDKDSYIVIGIGLNVNQSIAELPETGRAPATSACIEVGLPVDRRALLKKILERIEENIDKLADSIQRSQVQAVLEDRLRSWLPRSKKLTFYSAPAKSVESMPQTGIYSGLDAFGRILIATENGVTAYADAEIISIT